MDGYPRTPDGRYFVVRGRLWRCTNPKLPEHRRQQLVSDLMEARRDKKRALAEGSLAAVAEAKRSIDTAKTALGERGPVWWADGAPDLNRHLARTTIYADWYAANRIA